jgi:C-terminal domain of 1-Cys peroxiredoxin
MPPGDRDTTSGQTRQTMTGQADFPTTRWSLVAAAGRQNRHRPRKLYLCDDVNYPMIGDTELKIAKLYEMLPADSGNTSQGRTAATNATVRTVFMIGRDQKMKPMLAIPMSTSRNFDEVPRVLDSMQFTAAHQVATPVNWKHGEDVIILPSVAEEEGGEIPTRVGSRPSFISASSPQPAA